MIKSEPSGIIPTARITYQKFCINAVIQDNP